MGFAPLDDEALAEARRFNRLLDWAPRFKIRNRFMPLLIQSLLRLSQIGADRRLARAGIRVECRMVQADGIPASVPVRILRGERPPRAVVLDIHGGGWVIGDARMNDKLNSAMMSACDVAVVSVDYRLAVRAHINDLMDDCLAAARWLLAGGLPELDGLPVYIVGESAGGHLAAATLQRLTAWPELLSRIDGAILYYGVYDLAGTASVRLACADTLVLHGPTMASSLRLLTPDLDDEQRRQPPLSPLYGDLSGMPAALMFVGELDPLLDDTVTLAQRWNLASSAELHRLPEAPHGFIHFPTRMTRQVLAHAHAWLRDRIDHVDGVWR
jgi:acetyl esterase/lipase